MWCFNAVLWPAVVATDDPAVTHGGLPQNPAVTHGGLPRIATEVVPLHCITQQITQQITHMNRPLQRNANALYLLKG